jgi:hypothetical protein
MERELQREKSEDNDDSDYSGDEEKETENKKEKRTEIGNKNENENGLIGSKNSISPQNDIGTKENAVRNGGLEFSLYLDDSSTVDLYLELNSGVEKEIDYSDNLENSSNKSSMVSLSDETASVKNTKKNKFEDSKDSETQIVIPYKKQKTEKTIGTHTTFSTIENDTVGSRNDDDSSSNMDAILVVEKQKLLDNITDYFQNSNPSYNSKYLDKKTKERLTVLYNACTGVGLESLVLSDGMLMLMGYPGCDGEEGTVIFQFLNFVFSIFQIYRFTSCSFFNLFSVFISCKQFRNAYFIDNIDNILLLMFLFI